MKNKNSSGCCCCCDEVIVSDTKHILGTGDECHIYLNTHQIIDNFTFYGVFFEQRRALYLACTLWSSFAPFLFYTHTHTHFAYNSPAVHCDLSKVTKTNSKKETNTSICASLRWFSAMRVWIYWYSVVVIAASVFLFVSQLQTGLMFAI